MIDFCAYEEPTGWHFHQEVIGCPTLGAMLKVAPKHGVTIMGATTGIWPCIKAVFSQRKVIVGVNGSGELSQFWADVRETR